MYTSIGQLKYYEDWLVLFVDEEIVRYYRQFVPKTLNIRKQKYPPHISVVRKGKQIIPYMEFWNKYENESVEFNYDNQIHISEPYCWLNVNSIRLEEIRLELGLTRWTGYDDKCFHITLGNTKEV